MIVDGVADVDVVDVVLVALLDVTVVEGDNDDEEFDNVSPR